MPKNIAIVFIIVVLAVIGFLGYKNISSQNKTAQNSINSNPAPAQPPSQPETTLSPIFSYLSAWVPAATWETPKKVTKDTPAGKLTGMESEGKITDKNATIGRNFEDAKVMDSLGYGSENINFAADGPGASNWGYSRTKNGKTQVVMFSYSTNRLLGPEDTSPPFVNLSVFVSDPFTLK